ncbi:uncharacterized protein LOC127248916 [Andrographis paniculata]|uniref:uncharacterized protein LOC127248916 n=1 Tax=Andrographis paniculata TaxID=175694 RepID=UPI0021E7A2E4|nr:uncharacterized protein LOC127248916 [Andrographis paniculata]
MMSGGSSSSSALFRVTHSNTNGRPEILAQNALSTIRRNAACSSVFVIAVLISTVVIAAAYHPHDPFFNPTSSKITNSLTDSVNVSDVEFAVAQFEEPQVISDVTRECRLDEPIDCRDPDVFHSLMRAAMAKFKDIHFYRFGKPVRGDNESSCHMPWRFKPKEGKADRFYKDYRTFTVVRFENCTVSVAGIGDYHSGGNARKRKGQVKGKKVNGSNPLDVGDMVNEGLPDVESEASFISRKYLVYSGGGDRCKSMNQYLWSFVCMLGEAQYLNRTLIMDMSICLSKMYSSSGVDEEGKDFRFYFDFEHLKDSASVLGQAQFWSAWSRWHQKSRLKLHLVEDLRVTPMKLAGVKDTLIMRKFGSVEPDNYWYQVCEAREVESVVRRPWHMIWKSRPLLDMASAIAGRMNWDFDAVHVDRGEKARNKELWPSLDEDTRPEAILKVLQRKIEDGRQLYVTTNEQDTLVFNPLKDKYSTHFLDDYKDLWDVNGDWYDEMMKLNSGNSVEFDGYMRQSVDTEVFLKGKTQVETFNDLTKDCKDGINACTNTA